MRALVVLVRVMTVPRLLLVIFWYGEACEPGARPWLVAGRRVAEEEGFGSIGLRNASPTTVPARVVSNLALPTRLICWR